MDRRNYILGVIESITSDKIKAELIVERLTDEGLLILGYGNADVDRILQKFTDVFGTTKSSKYDRFAAGRLAKKYGSQSVCGIIGLLGDHSQEKYSPVVGSVAQLEDKWVTCIAFIRKLSDKGEMVDV